MGNVERIFTRGEQNRATHLLIAAGWLFKERRLIPVDWIRSVEEDEIQLGSIHARSNKCQPTKAKPLSNYLQTGEKMTQIENLLDHGELQNIRQQLESQRHHLIAGIENYNSSESHSRVYNLDRTELANQYSSQDRGIALRTLDQQTLRQIEQALARLDEGSYGLCVKCQRPIHPDRLEVLPYATLCVTCQLATSQKV